jgi:hypothetical protein
MKVLNLYAGEVFKYNDNAYTVTFERGDKLNKGEMR